MTDKFLVKTHLHENINTSSEFISTRCTLSSAQKARAYGTPTALLLCFSSMLGYEKLYTYIHTIISCTYILCSTYPKVNPLDRGIPMHLMVICSIKGV